MTAATETDPGLIALHAAADWPGLVRQCEGAIQGALSRIGVPAGERADIAQKTRLALLEVMPRWRPADGQLSTFTKLRIDGTIKNAIKKALRTDTVDGAAMLGIANVGPPLANNPDGDAQDPAARLVYADPHRMDSNRDREARRLGRVLRDEIYRVWMQGAARAIKWRPGQKISAELHGIYKGASAAALRVWAERYDGQGEQRTVPQIARRLQMSEGQVKAALKAAQRHIRDMPQALRDMPDQLEQLLHRMWQHQLQRKPYNPPAAIVPTRTAAPPSAPPPKPAMTPRATPAATPRTPPALPRRGAVIGRRPAPGSTLAQTLAEFQAEQKRKQALEADRKARKPLKKRT